MNQLLIYMTNYIRENPLDPRHQRSHFFCPKDSSSVAKIINPLYPVQRTLWPAGKKLTAENKRAQSFRRELYRKDTMTRRNAKNFLDSKIRKMFPAKAAKGAKKSVLIRSIRFIRVPLL